jgi:lipoyl(octanoyl) transferase
MSIVAFSPEESRPAVQAHLLGEIDFERALALQNRLVYEAGGSRQPPITLLICEHPNLITVGRLGSRAHVLCQREELVSRELSIRWVNRGGGCVLHTPGQLAVYPIVALQEHGWRAGEYAARLQAGIMAALAEVGVVGETRANAHGIWGRSGHLVMLGIAVKHAVAYHGAFINVAPAMHLVRLVDPDPWRHSPAGSLVAERQQPVRMQAVREAQLRRLTEALGCDRFHLYSGHPLLPPLERSHRATARVG